MVKVQLGYYSYIWKTWISRFYWGLVLALWRNTYGERQLITKCRTWNVTVPNKIQIGNGKQERNNKEFKTKTYKKANLRISLTNLYATKSVSHSKQKIRTDLPKVTSKDTRTAWADANQMY